MSSVIPTHVLEGRGARRGSALSRSNSVKRSPSSQSGAPGTPAGVLRDVGSSLRNVRSVLGGGASARRDSRSSSPLARGSPGRARAASPLARVSPAGQRAGRPAEGLLDTSLDAARLQQVGAANGPAPPSPAAAASAGGEQLSAAHSLLPGQVEERGDAGGGAAEGGEGRGEGQQAGVGLDPWTPVAAAGANGPHGGAAGEPWLGEHDPATLLQEPLQRGAPLHESPLVRRASGSAHSAALSCSSRFPQESEVPPARALRRRAAAARPVLLPGRGRARPALTDSKRNENGSDGFIGQRGSGSPLCADDFDLRRVSEPPTPPRARVRPYAPRTARPAAGPAALRVVGRGARRPGGGGLGRSRGRLRTTSGRTCGGDWRTSRLRRRTRRRGTRCRTFWCAICPRACATTSS
jgi:hypothetical protein